MQLIPPGGTFCRIPSKEPFVNGQSTCAIQKYLFEVTILGLGWRVYLDGKLKVSKMSRDDGPDFRKFSDISSALLYIVRRNRNERYLIGFTGMALIVSTRRPRRWAALTGYLCRIYDLGRHVHGV